MTLPSESMGHAENMKYYQTLSGTSQDTTTDTTKKQTPQEQAEAFGRRVTSTVNVAMANLSESYKKLEKPEAFG